MKQSNAFTVLKVLHIALLISMAIFGVTAILVVQLVQPAPTGADDSFQRNFQVVCILLSALALLGGFRLFKKKIFAARNSLEPGEKRMELYRTACILWWAMIEGPAIVAGIGFILTGNYAFLALTFFHLLALLAFAPRKANIILFLNLNSDEVVRLEGKG